MTKCQTAPLAARMGPMLALAGLVWLMAAGLALAGSAIERFVGEFAGSAEVLSASGETQTRDMGVEIEETKDGFAVTWTSTTIKSDGRRKEKKYSIEFENSERDHVFSAAMQRNIFGHAVQLDPMKGDPYVWGRVVSDTLTVYSMHINEDGGYEIQQFDRTLTDGGLTLEFLRVHDGFPQKSVVAFLKRLD